MKKPFKFLFVLALVGCFMPSLPFGFQATVLSAQTAPTRTTLSAAMAAGARTMVVTSATGFTSSGGTSACPTNQCFVLVENDLRQVLNVSSTTISLGPSKGAGVGHVSGATVVFGPPGTWQTGTAGVASGSTGLFPPSLATGSCSRGNQQFLPLFVPTSSTNGGGGTLDCLGGQWVTGTLPDAPGNPYLVGACTVPIGSVALGSFGTSTTTSTTGQLNASIFVPYTMWAAGITQLNGSAVDGTSKKIVILNDKNGTPLANSATAGTTASGNDAFQSIAFTASRFVVGPAYYVVSLQDDTADVNGVRTVATATFNNLVAGSTSSVFGTVAAITVPTTFTQDTGPIACIN